MKEVVDRMLRSSLVDEWHRRSCAIKTYSEICPTDVAPVIAPNRSGKKMLKMFKVNLIIVLMSLMITGCTTQQGNIYTPEDIDETCGFKNERSRDFKMAGVESINVLSTKSSIDERFDYMDFYIFESKADARRAFKKTTSWFSDIEEEDDDHRLGWQAGVCDAEVESYEYLTGNMIILVDMQVVSSWDEVIPVEGEDIDDNMEETQIVEEQGPNEWSQSYREGIIDLMRETFR